MSDWTVGQEVLLQTGPAYNRRSVKSIIEKITPTGKLRVKGSVRLFGADGYSFAPDRFSNSEKVTPFDDLAAEVLRRGSAHSRVTSAIHAVDGLRRRVSGMSADTAEELATALEAAIAKATSQ